MTISARAAFAMASSLAIRCRIWIWPSDYGRRAEARASDPLGRIDIPLWSAHFFGGAGTAPCFPSVRPEGKANIHGQPPGCRKYHIVKGLTVSRSPCLFCLGKSCYCRVFPRWWRHEFARRSYSPGGVSGTRLDKPLSMVVTKGMGPLKCDPDGIRVGGTLMSAPSKC